jgi:hypothetical protein
MQYWQVAAGSAGRDYSDVFLKYGMAFVGGDVQRKTMNSVSVDDRMVLKRGMSEILAVGEVVERNGQSIGDADKDWLRDFDGWDLAGYCYVDWRIPEKPIPTTGLTRATIQGINKQSLKDEADKLMNISVAEFLPEPEEIEKNELDTTQMIGFLVEEGLRPAAAEELTATFNRIKLLANYYYHKCDWSDVREHEARTFLIIPLLLALGWSEQQIKIELGAAERGRIDIACFMKPYRRTEGKPNNEDCVLLIETKGFAHGLDYAHEQGKGYAKTFPSCEVVIATNGYCYKAYLKNEKEGKFEEKPQAYLNLLRPRKKFPRDSENVGGGLEMLRLLLPQHWMTNNKMT